MMSLLVRPPIYIEVVTDAGGIPAEEIPAMDLKAVRDTPRTGLEHASTTSHFACGCQLRSRRRRQRKRCQRQCDEKEHRAAKARD